MIIRVIVTVLNKKIDQFANFREINGCNFHGRDKKKLLIFPNHLYLIATSKKSDKSQKINYRVAVHIKVPSRITRNAYEPQSLPLSPLERERERERENFRDFFALNYNDVCPRRTTYVRENMYDLNYPPGGKCPMNIYHRARPPLFIDER
uniref:Uncharacterized protein n=1 Tax=Glypta fumiferanae TaxID=389681 RepID=A0A0F6Q8F4_9HYME|nr:hypothetical protein [Glypta fumiferanae]